MSKNRIITLVLFVILSGAFYFVLFNFKIFPCIVAIKEPGTGLTHFPASCELVSVIRETSFLTRNPHLSGIQLKPVGYGLALFVIGGSAALIAYVIGFKVIKKKS